MELRELKYFLAVAREESLTKAAESLFITQPNLTRQMQNLENEIGRKLFIRGSRKITLTEEGLFLKKRADEIIELCNKTEKEIYRPSDNICGDIYIGSGESHAVRTVALAAKTVQSEYPDIKFHIFSGDIDAVTDKLDKGLIDFGVVIEPADLSRYDHMQLPLKDVWGVLMRKDSPLSIKEKIRAEDLWNLPLIRSKHSLDKGLVNDWFRKGPSELNIAATYNLIYNASLFVEEGLGYAIVLDKLINVSDNGNLCFKPLFPTLESRLSIVWKKNRVFTPAAKYFHDTLLKILLA